jgi:glutamine amidotransferase
MCRWLAYSGSPILLEEALYAPAHSLIDQSLHSRLGAETTNGDGFGVGWYGAAPIPGVFRSTEPAWNDQNLHELAGHISSGHFFAHIRAAIGSAVQQTNCHPFRHGRWLFMHNGYIKEFDTIKRDLVLVVDPTLYPMIKGQADSEVLFYLALTLGLEDDPPSAIEHAIGLVEAVGARHGVADPFQGTIATTDGESIWALRYASAGEARSLYYTTDVPTLRKLYPERELYARASVDARLIVSEPLGDIAGVWNAVPEATFAIVAQEHDELRAFQPKTPAAALQVAG